MEVGDPKMNFVVKEKSYWLCTHTDHHTAAAETCGEARSPDKTDRRRTLLLCRVVVAVVVDVVVVLYDRVLLFTLRSVKCFPQRKRIKLEHSHTISSECTVKSRVHISRQACVTKEAAVGWTVL